MVKMIMLIFLMIQVTMAANLPELIQENRVKIGPTVNPPIEFQGKLYFLANSGVLFESNYDLSEIKNLFETELASFSPITLHEGVLYFGEGLHEHKKANLYAYDLKEKKLKFKMKLEGHIERAISIVDGIAYLGFGPGGIGAIDLSQQKIIWQKKEIKAGVLHVDSNIIVYQKNICATSVYNYKGVFCLNAADGSELFNVSLRLSPKSEITLDGELLYGFSTEATMNDMNWKTPTSFYVVNLVKKNIQMEIELRGYNFFAPLAIKDRKVFATLSTGDLITISLKNGKIDYVGEFPEPLVSTPFYMQDELCAFGIMGQLLCYKQTKTGYALTKEKRYYETSVGKVSAPIAGKIYVPSRMGHFLL